jgi:hypothetical protein
MKKSLSLKIKRTRIRTSIKAGPISGPSLPHNTSGGGNS